MTEVERLAHERADSLRRESAALTGEMEGFLVFARENCNYVALLSLIWQVVTLRLQRGGAPTKLLLHECDLLLSLIAAPEHFLGHIARVWHERELPEELAEPIYADVQSARERLTALGREIRNIRERASDPPRVSADPEELKQRIKEADEGQEWVPLREAITRMRQSTPPK